MKIAAYMFASHSDQYTYVEFVRINEKRLLWSTQKPETSAKRPPEKKLQLYNYEKPEQYCIRSH